MQVRLLHGLEGARAAAGVTVIIDVFRAFSTAAYAIAGGAREVLPVETIEEAWAARRERPEALLVGERGGKMVEGFDHGNSPTELRATDLTGRTIVLTTTAGTKGLVNARAADEILTGALVNVGATVRYIRDRRPAVVSVVAMGSGGTTPTAEDTGCGELIAAMLQDETFDRDAMETRIREAPSGRKFADPTRPWFRPTDLDLCLALDAFAFALRVEAHPLTGRALRPVES